MLKKIYDLLTGFKDTDPSTDSDIKIPPLKIVKIYNDNGTLIKTFENVYIEHWDKNIYNLYKEKGGKRIMRLVIGANMLMTSEDKG